MSTLRCSGTRWTVLAEQAHTDVPALVLIGTIGTDARIWGRLADELDAASFVVTVDLPGHGSAPPISGPGRMGALITAVETALDDAGIREAVVLGHGVGGLVAQGLAVKRLDLVRGLILSATAARIGFSGHWTRLARDLRDIGPEALVSTAAATWVPKGTDPEYVAAMIRRQSAEAMAQVAEAAAGSDFYTTTATLRLPTLALVGSLDRVTPPDLVRETAALVPGSDVQLIAGAGHLSMLDQPELYASAVRGFLDRIGHTAPRTSP